MAAAPSAAVPANPSFTAVGSMTTARWFHTATLLGNGKVLIAGGTTATFAALNTAELFDPATGTFTTLSSTMSAIRFYHTATLLPNGKVLIAGGSNGNNAATNRADLFDPASNTFTALPNGMTSTRDRHTATLLPSGKVLIAGGYGSGSPLTSGISNTAELFDPASGTFTPVPNTMTSARDNHTATLLPSGKVLLAGGDDGNMGVFPSTAELFDPAAGTFTALPLMISPRLDGTATLLPTGKVLLAGGYTNVGATNTAELFDPTAGTFMVVASSMNSVRYAHTATLLPDGMVLVAGGNTGTTADLFDPTAGTFAAVSSMMNSARFGHSATLLPSGMVLLAGGSSDSGLAGITNKAELFDPASGAGAFTSLLPNTIILARYYHTATLLPSGKALITGGSTDDPTNPVTNTAELFDPSAGNFSSLPSMA